MSIIGPLKPPVRRRYDVMMAALLIVLLSYAVFQIFVALGPPIGHSFHLNALWGQAFVEQFSAGEIYPRWLFSVNAEAGSPVFYFYGPFPFWIQSLAERLLCSACDPDRALMAGPVLLLALSGISFFLWIRDHVSTSTALFAAIFYLFLPYHFLIDLWYRQAIGEFAAYVSMPLVLLGLERASGAPRYLCLAAAGYAVLLFSHLPSALLFSPLIIFFVVLHYRPRQWVPFVTVPVVLGCALAAIYLVPALTTQEYINAAAWWNTEDGHFVARNWLWLDGREAPDPWFASKVLYSLAVPSLLGLLLAAGLFVNASVKKAKVLFLMISLLYAWFLMTSPSALLWSHLDLLAKVQFPWRAGIIVDLCTASLVALSLEQACRRARQTILITCVALAAIALPYADNLEHMERHLLTAKDADEQQAIADRLAHADDAFEYRTAWSVAFSGDLPHADINDVLAATPEVRMVSGAGTLGTVDGAPDRLSVTLDATTPVQLRFRRFYYPGWQLTGAPDGHPIEIIAADELGLIDVALPAGRHHLVLQREPIIEERIGMAVSVGALVLCLLVLANNHVSRRYRKAS